jgi:hypothetical protein
MTIDSKSRIRDNKIKSRNNIEQDEHCDVADARRVKLVDEGGDPINSLNPFPVDVVSGNINVGTVQVDLTHLDNYPNPGDTHDSIRVGNGINLWDITTKKEGRVADTLHTGGTNTIITVADTPVEVKVGVSAKTDRKTIFVVPRAKGIFWGFKSNVDTTDGVNGGTPLGKNQPLEINAEITTPVYLVGPSGGVKVYIAEA